MTVSKKAKSKRAPRKKGKRAAKFPWLRFILKSALAAVIFFFLLVFAVYLGFLGKIPNRDELMAVKTPLASEVFSADGKLLGRYYTQNRSYAAYDEISPHIIHALVATEDARFFKHRGIDEIALLRVLFKTILLVDKTSGGGSTLSQQIAKNLFPRRQFTFLSLPVNKIREAIIAYRLERIYSKEEILTLYLNTVPFGENIFGIEVASERFFSKAPSEINLAEAAVLVGILKGNSLFNPRLHPDRSVERRNTVIDQMVRQKLLTRAEGEKFKAQPLNLRYRVITYNQGPAPYFLEYIRPDLIKWCKNHKRVDGESFNLYTDGLKIYTTIDSRLQQYANNAVSEQMKQLQVVFDTHWKGKEPWGGDQSVLNRAIRRTERYQRGEAAGKSRREIMEEFSIPVEMTLFTWDGLKSSRITPLDSVKHYLSMLNAGLMVLENKTGAIKAWVGGIDFRFFKYDYTGAQRQAGSTFKPVVYLAALENGLSPLDYYSAEEETYDEYDGWTPGNAGDAYSGYYTMKAALAKSINTVTVDIMMQTGISSTIQTARNLGLKAPLPEVPSLALGTASLSLRDMVSLYAAIANQGKPVTPYAILKIEDSRGKQLDVMNVPPPGEGKVDPENCLLITDMLREAVNTGTGSSIRSRFKLPGEFAGKTGTTQENADGWFIGYSPDFCAGCRVGSDDPAIHFRTMNYGQGAFMALPIVGNFFSRMFANPQFKDYAFHHFETPDSSLLAEINDLPGHVDHLDRDFGFFDFLTKKEPKIKTTDRKEDVKESPQQKKDEEPVWEKIKRIFKKNEKPSR